MHLTVHAQVKEHHRRGRKGTRGKAATEPQLQQLERGGPSLGPKRPAKAQRREAADVALSPCQRPAPMAAGQSEEDAAPSGARQRGALAKGPSRKRRGEDDEEADWEAGDEGTTSEDEGGPNYDDSNDDSTAELTGAQKRSYLKEKQVAATERAHAVKAAKHRTLGGRCVKPSEKVADNLQQHAPHRHGKGL